MSDPFEDPIHDLFDFPEVEGLEEFGLVPPIPPALRAEQAAAAAEAAGAQAGSQSEETPEGDSLEPGVARPNPPVPEGVTDLDEDLFQFDELFSIEDDPYRNGTLGADGQPMDTSFMDPAPAADPLDLPEALDSTEFSDAESQQPAPLEPEPQRAAPTPQAPPQPVAPQAREPYQQPAPTAPLPSSFPPANGEAQPAGHALRDRGPRILLPEDVPYSIGGENQRMLWALIACFLVLCAGMFYVTYQSSKAFQATLLSNTDRLAAALDRNQAGALAQAPVAVAPTSASVPVDPSLSYSIDLPGSLPRGADLPKRSQSDRWIDPRNYANTHEFAVGNAKAMLADGQFEDARRLLNHVLANQARIPLSPALREEIDYLIPLTYFEHGNATAPNPGGDR